MSSSTGAVVVIGECVADIVRMPGCPDQVHPGGSPANVACGLARLGRPVLLVTELGPDGNGQLIRDHLARTGVRVQAAEVGQTPTALVTLDSAGRAEYTFDIAWTLPSIPTLHGPPHHLHTGSIAAVAEPGDETIWRTATELRRSATISYDPNIRPALMGDHPAAVARVERGVAGSDVVKVSDEDLAWLYPGRAVERVAGEWLALGVSLLLITLGGEGALAFAGGRNRMVPAREVTVADTVGAGDAFMSGSLHALAGIGALGAASRRKLAALDGAELDEVLHCASAAAALTVAVAGAVPPDAAALAEARRRV